MDKPLEYYWTKRLADLQQRMSLARNRGLVGGTVEVLTEGPSRKDPGMATARTMGPCMAMGQAAGAMAALSARTGVDPEDLALEDVRSLLREHGASERMIGAVWSIETAGARQ